MNQKIIALLLAGLSLFPLTTPISAKLPDSGIIAPQWDYINNIVINFNFIKNKATVTVSRQTQATTKLDATITIYKKVGNNWTYVTSNSGSNSRSLCVEVEFDAVSGVTYKAVADVTAYSANGSETATESRIETCP